MPSQMVDITMVGLLVTEEEPAPNMGAEYDYQVPWLVAALSTCHKPNFRAEDGVDMRQFPQFSPLENEVHFQHSTRYIGMVGAIEHKLCCWDCLPGEGPLRLKMSINRNAGVMAERADISAIFELKPVGSQGNDDNVYGVFALVPLKEGEILTLKCPTDTANGSAQPLNFGAEFIRNSGKETPPANARMTANGVIRAITTIEKGAEVVLVSSSEITGMHPVDFLDRRLLMPANCPGDYHVKMTVGHVEKFFHSSDGSVSYIATITGIIDGFTKEHTISQSEVLRLSIYTWGAGAGSRSTAAIANVAIQQEILMSAEPAACGSNKKKRQKTSHQEQESISIGPSNKTKQSENWLANDFFEESSFLPALPFLRQVESSISSRGFSWLFGESLDEEMQHSSLLGTIISCHQGSTDNEDTTTVDGDDEDDNDGVTLKEPLTSSSQFSKTELQGNN